MNVLTIAALAWGSGGFLGAVWFYYHLWKWGRDCQQATVVVAYKRKVVMSPTLVEVLLWSRKVPPGQGGQVFYKGGNVTIAVTRRQQRTWRQKRQIRRNRQPGQAQAQAGVWDVTQNKTNEPAQ